MNKGTYKLGLPIEYQEHSEIDKAQELLISHDKYTILRDDSEPEVRANTFSLQMLLEKNGFEVVAQYDMKGRRFVPEKSLNILTVTKIE